METTVRGKFFSASQYRGKIRILVTIPPEETREVLLEPHEAEALGVDLIGRSRMALMDRPEEGQAMGMAEAKNTRNHVPDF